MANDEKNINEQDVYQLVGSNAKGGEPIFNVSMKIEGLEKERSEEKFNLLKNTGNALFKSATEKEGLEDLNVSSKENKEEGKVEYEVKNNDGSDLNEKQQKDLSSHFEGAATTALKATAIEEGYGDIAVSKQTENQTKAQQPSQTPEPKPQATIEEEKSSSAPTLTMNPTGKK